MKLCKSVVALSEDDSQLHVRPMGCC